MSSHPSSSSDPVTHSEPIPINTSSNYRTRPRSTSEVSDEESVPPLSPTSESPASAPGIQTPISSNPRVQVNAVPPSSPILSYFYGAPNKSPFGGVSASDRAVEDEKTQDAPQIPTNPGFHGRRVSTSSWIPVRFGPQQNMTESQSERGAGVLRRLSLSSSIKPMLPGQGYNATPPNSPQADTGTGPPRRPSPRVAGQHHKAATLGPGTIDANKMPRAPSPMGERILKGFFDGF